MDRDWWGLVFVWIWTPLVLLGAAALLAIAAACAFRMLEISIRIITVLLS